MLFIEFVGLLPEYFDFLDSKSGLEIFSANRLVPGSVLRVKLAREKLKLRRVEFNPFDRETGFRSQECKALLRWNRDVSGSVDLSPVFTIVVPRPA